MRTLLLFTALAFAGCATTSSTTTSSTMPQPQAFVNALLDFTTR